MKIFVIKLHTSPLALRNVRRNSKGRITSGYVINGGWYYSYKNGVAYAKESGGRIANSWFEPEVVDEFLIPDGITGDYSDLIEYAITNEAQNG